MVWATGFRQVFDWIKLPILGEDGWPVEYRGAVEDQPGLFFCGLSFQFGFGSMVLPGVGRDAEFVARKITDRVKSSTPKQAGRRVSALSSEEEVHGMGVVDDLRQARETFERGDWVHAFEAWSELGHRRPRPR